MFRVQRPTKESKASVRNFKVGERYTSRNGRASSLYIQEVAKTKLLTPEEEARIGTLAAAGDLKAQNRLVESNLRFVLSVAKMYSQDADVIEELVQVGNIGLIEASKKFDPSRGFKFISFAVWHIRKEMIYFLSHNSRTIRIPENKNQILQKVREVQTQLLGRLGREPDVDEVADALRKSGHKLSEDMDTDRLRVLLAADQKVSSLDHHYGDDEGGGTLLELLWDENDVHDQNFDREHYKFFVDTAISKLSERERKVVVGHLGLDGGVFSKPFSSFSEEWGIGAEQVRNIYNRALKKLKQSIKRMRRQGDIFL